MRKIRFAGASALSALLATAPAAQAQMTLVPAPDERNLGTLVSEVGTLTLPDVSASRTYATQSELPDVTTVSGHPFVRAAVRVRGKTFLLDSSLTTALPSALPPSVYHLVSQIGDDSLYFTRWVDTEKETRVEIGRFDVNANRVLWTLSGLRSWWTGNPYTGLVTYPTPIEIWPSEDPQILQVVGLEDAERYPGKPAKTLLLRINRATGEKLSERAFDVRRRIPLRARPLDARTWTMHSEFDPHVESGEVLVDIGGAAVAGVRPGQAEKTGRLRAGDVLFDRKKTPPIETDRLFTHEILPLAYDGGLLLVSHVLEGRDGSDPPAAMSLEQSSWVRLDSDGQRSERLQPAPDSSPAFAVRNLGEAAWPQVFSNLARSSGAGLQVHLYLTGFTLVDRDGSIGTAPLPELRDVKGKAIRVDLWRDSVFRANRTLYVLAKDALYASVLGETSASVLCRFPPKSDLAAIWGRNGMVLLGERYRGVRQIVIDLHDGRELSEQELRERGALDFLDRVLAYKRVGTPLPTGGLPATVNAKDLGKYEAAEVESVSEDRLWGFVPGETVLGDIHVKQVKLKDDSALLIGVQLPENEVAFWLPVARYKGKPKGASWLDSRWIGWRADAPAWKLNVDREQILLLVQESASTFKVYRVNRPTSAKVEPPA